jgi:probable F420-dependent oxidoreductase
MPGDAPQLTELGFYGLAGHTEQPRDLVEEVAEAERLGLGSVFLSERFNVKDAAVLSGAAGAVSTTLGIATAATNHTTRHPMVTATVATTMHRLTGGRFALGLGRGIELLNGLYGIPTATTAQLEDVIDLLRRLWHGDLVMAHDGPAGSYPLLHQSSSFDEDIPIVMTAMGERTLELAGRVSDGVVLHTYFTDETLARCVAAVRRGAEQAGRDPAAVRVWSVLATVGDHLPEEIRLRKTVGRLATYLQGYGDLMVRVNDWDPEVLVRFRQDDVVASFPGALDATGTTDVLEHVAGLLPDEWLAPAATGSAAACAGTVLGQFDLGADGVIMHGATPQELAPVVEAYRNIRPAGRFDGLPANPGAPIA